VTIRNLTNKNVVNVTIKNVTVENMTNKNVANSFRSAAGCLIRTSPFGGPPVSTGSAQDGFAQNAFTLKTVFQATLVD
jgi:hypothetical protein